MIEIRPAEGREHETLSAVAHAAKRVWGYPEAWIELWKDDLTFTPESIAEHPTFCAVIGGKVVGVYALSLRDDGSELEHFWVLPGFMGKGFGRRLFEHAADTARAAGANHMRIAADPNALEFYRRMGARQVGEIHGRPEGRVLPLLVIHLSGDFA